MSSEELLLSSSTLDDNLQAMQDIAGAVQLVSKNYFLTYMLHCR